MAKLKINWQSKALVDKQARLFSFPKSKAESVATASLLSVLKSVDEFGNAQSAYLISQQELNSMPVCVAAPADFASDGGEYQTASFTANAGV